MIEQKDIPKDWKWVPLEDTLEYFIGGDWGKDENCEDPSYGFAYCIRGSEIKNWNEDKGNTASLRKIKLNNIKKRELVEGDILVEISGGGPEQPVGRTVLIDKSVLNFKPSVPKICTNFLRLIRPKSDFDSKFLNLYLTLFYYSGEVVNYQAGSNNLRNLKFPDYLTIGIPKPKLSLQQAIVSKIEELFSELDNGIAQLKTALQQLKTCRQAVLKYAFEGRLTNKNVKDGELPEGWKWVKLGEVCEVKRGKSKHRPRDDKKLYGGDYPFIQTGDVKAANGGFIRNYYQTYSELGLQQSKLWPKGTLCLTIAANIADTAFLGFDACFPDSIVGIVAIENIIHLKYISYIIQKLKKEIDVNASATAQKNINVEFLDNLEIPHCSIDEQLQIIQEIERRLSVADKLQETIDTALAQSESLRQSILKQAFEGKLVRE